MNTPIPDEIDTQELRRDEGISTSIKDPDRMLSIIVLVLACLGLALLAHVVV